MEAEASLYVGELNIAQLSDEELYQRLTDMGAAVGPIVASTRKTYERKLAVLMGADVANYSFTGNVPATIEADDRDVEPTSAYLERLSAGDSYPRRRKPQLGSRSVVYDDEDEEDTETGEYREAGGEQPYNSPSSLYTPSPRRPLHSPDTSYTTSSYRHQESYLSSPSTQASINKQEQVAEEKGGSGQLLFMILLVVVVLVVAYYFVAARPEKDAFASLEHLAKTAADALEKEQQQQHQDPRTGL